jgi:predicted transcriptional regulator
VGGGVQHPAGRRRGDEGRAVASSSADARFRGCVTVSYVKSSTITIRLDEALERDLDQACARTGRTRSDLARDALRRQLALLRFERLRRKVLPLAESQGYLADEDVFRDVS